jgi:hypothetical protein
MKSTSQRLARLIFLAGFLLLSGLTGLLVNVQQATAYSNYLTAAENQYPSILGTKLDSCQLCHPAGGYGLNPYAQDYKNAGHSFTSIEQLDSDKDGYANIVEITALTWPGDPSSYPVAAATSTPTPTRTLTPTPLPTNPGPTSTSTATSLPASATPTPTQTSVPTVTDTPPAGATPTRIPVPVPANRFAFLGEVTGYPLGGGYEGDWIVSGRVVHVGSTTWLEQPGLLGQRSQVWVWGRRAAGGSVDATYIRILTKGAPAGDATFTPSPTATKTVQPSDTPRPTVTPSATRTPKPYATATRTPAPTRTPEPTDDDDRRPSGTNAGGN